MPSKKKQSAVAAVNDIRRRIRRKFSSEEKIRIVLEGLCGEQSVSELCRREQEGPGSPAQLPKRSRFITLVQAATKSLTNFSRESSKA